MDFLFVNSSGSVYRGSPDLGVLTFLRDYPETFTDLAITRDGRVLATTFRTLYELDLSTGTKTVLTTFGTGMNGLTATADGRIYVSGDDDSVLVLDDRTYATIDTISLPSGTASAGDVVVRDGSLYYTSRAGRLLTIDLDTGDVTDSVAHGLSAAFGLHFAQGRLYAYSGTGAYAINPETGATVLAGTAVGLEGIFYGSASAPATMLRGGAQDDAIRCYLPGLGASGGGGDDLLVGSDGRNRLFGQVGDDRLRGMGGSDVLDGGVGDDRLAGGRGGDTFVFAAGMGRDRIDDFRDDTDTLRLDDALWGGRDLSAVQVVRQFAHVHDGDLVLNFGDGDVVILEGFRDRAELADDLLIA